MFPTLSHLLDYLFGFYLPLPIQTFGFFVALAFLGCAWVFSTELKRKEDLGYVQPNTKKVLKGEKASITDYISSGIIGFLLGFKLVYAALNYASFVDNPQDGILSMDGNWFAGILFCAVALWWKKRESDKNSLPEPVWEEVVVHPYEEVGNMTMIAAVSGILGAKLFHLFENPDEFVSSFSSAQSFFSGLTIYGGLICGTICVLWYAKKKGLTALSTADSCAPGLMLAYGIGRMGCQLSGDGDWGINNPDPKPDWLSFLPDWAWSFTFPGNVINAGAPMANCTGKFCSELMVPVWPTALYESVMGICLFLLLWLIRKQITTPGVMFCCYLMVNGIERFFIEKVRINEVIELFGMMVTQAEIISTCFFVLGVIGIFYFRKNRERLAKF